MKVVYQVCLLTICVTSLLGCGNKGDLFLETDRAVAEQLDVLDEIELMDQEKLDDRAKDRKKTIRESDQGS